MYESMIVELIGGPCDGEQLEIKPQQVEVWPSGHHLPGGRSTDRRPIYQREIGKNTARFSHYVDVLEWSEV